MSENYKNYLDLLANLNNNVKKSINNNTKLDTLETQIKQINYLMKKLQISIQEVSFGSENYEKNLKTLEISKEVLKY